ncbi:MAG: glycoside hydrolase [Armatimonadota bacterium]
MMASAIAPQWRLVWKDEFTPPGAPSPKNWTYETGYIRNNEAQFYTENRRENARVEGGRLIIEARKDNFKGNEVTSASITTQGKHSMLYGRVVVRAKIPTGRGTWPAIWMLGTNITSVGWPRCGEIDIMENVGHNPEDMVFTIHRAKTESETGDVHKFEGKSIQVKEPWKQFHDYELQWFPDRLDQLMDGKLVHTYRRDPQAGPEQWPFDKPQYLILNLAIGGSLGGQKGIDDAIFPARLEIDYVRVYEQIS